MHVLVRDRADVRAALGEQDHRAFVAAVSTAPDSGRDAGRVQPVDDPRHRRAAALVRRDLLAVRSWRRVAACTTVRVPAGTTSEIAAPISSLINVCGARPHGQCRFALVAEVDVEGRPASVSSGWPARRLAHAYVLVRRSERIVVTAERHFGVVEAPSSSSCSCERRVLLRCILGRRARCRRR